MSRSSTNSHFRVRRQEPDPNVPYNLLQLDWSYPNPFSLLTRELTGLCERFASSTMDSCTLKMVSSSSSAGLAVPAPSKFSCGMKSNGLACFGVRVKLSKDLTRKIRAIVSNGSVSSSNEESNSVRDVHSLESMFCYDKPIPEQIIEKPVGTSLAEKVIGDKPRCTDCEAKGAVLCLTCSGSGLYVDSIMESQGIIVKVRCLGCGGTGNIMCSECGGRGHLE